MYVPAPAQCGVTSPTHRPHCPSARTPKDRCVCAERAVSSGDGGADTPVPPPAAPQHPWNCPYHACAPHSPAHRTGARVRIAAQTARASTPGAGRSVSGGGTARRAWFDEHITPPLASGAAYGPPFLPPRAAPCTLPSEPFLCARSGGGVRAARTPYAPREAGATRAGGRVGGHTPMAPPRAPPTRRTRARTDVRAHLRVEPPRRARMLLMPSARAPGRRRLARGSRWARFSGALWYHRNAHRNIVRP